MDTTPRNPESTGIMQTTVWPQTIRPLMARGLRRYFVGPRKSHIRATVTQAGLPETIQAVIFRILKRARLWRREQLDVAGELASHFADGLAAGRDEHDLINNFGNPDAAARLIGRAKRRTRPLWWRTYRMGLRSAGVMMLAAIVLYTVLAIQYFGAKPTIARNYLAELNAAALMAPEPERAWPIYRRAIVELEPLTPTLNERSAVIATTDPRWPEVAAYLDRNRAAIELIHQAADKPALGCALGTESARAIDHERYLRHTSPEAFSQTSLPPHFPDPTLFGATQPFLLHARELARVISADCKAAIAANDAPRVEQDLQSLMRIGTHARSQPFLVAVLTGQAIEALAFESIKTVLTDAPDLLSSLQLRDLAHAIAALGEPADQLGDACRGERTAFLDFIQRLYTDDGGGDGHLTAEGMARYNELLGAAIGQNGNPDATNALMPLAAGAALGRRDIIAFYDEMLRRGIEDIQTPIWQRTPESSAEFQYDNSARGWLKRARYWPAGMLVPAFNHFARTAYTQRAHRDASLAAIALEVFRRDHGSFPAALTELTPRYLPVTPIDPIDGQPLRYRVIDGRPVLYSVGTDGEDDGGRPNPWNNAQSSHPPPVTGFAVGSPERQQWLSNVDGDWVLFPTPVDAKPPARRPPPSPM